MGAGASTAKHPFPDEAAALAAGKTQEEIDSYKASIKVRFIYLPVVGRGEQIHLLAAEHGLEYETVLPKGDSAASTCGPSRRPTARCRCGRRRRPTGSH